MSARGLYHGAREVFERFSNDQVFQLAAALAFYTMLSLAPLLLLIVGMASIIYGEQAAQGQLVDQIEAAVGQDGAQAIQTILANAHEVGGGGISIVVGIVILLFGATTVMAQLQNSLNQIWDVKPASEQSSIRLFVRTRLASLGIVLLVGVIFIASLVASSLIAGAQTQLEQLLPGLGRISQALELLLSIAVLTLLVAVLFKYLPDVQIAWGDLWVGALMTAILLVAGKYLIALYLSQAAVGDAFGAAGSLVVLLVWIYYSALMLFLGAEITQVYARRVGARIEPADYAVRTTAEPKSDAEPRQEPHDRAA